ncbi:sulfite reductase [NADPH] flavoprotein component [Cystobasidiomycetes sp. EMM_F5]
MARQAAATKRGAAETAASQAKRSRVSAAYPAATSNGQKAVSFDKPIAILEKAVVAKSSATFVYDSWPTYAAFPAGDNVYKLEARQGAGVFLKGFVSNFAATSGAISILATPGSLNLLAGVLAEVSTSSRSIVVHVAANSSNIADLYEALQLVTFASQGYQGDIVFSGGQGASQIIQTASAAYAQTGKTIIHVFDDVQAGQEYTLLPQIDGAASPVEPATYSGPSAPSAVIVLPSSAHSASATAALAGLAGTTASGNVGIVTVNAIRGESFGDDVAGVLPASVQTLFAPVSTTSIDESASWFYDNVLSSVTGTGKLAGLIQPLSVVQSWTVHEWAATLVRVASPSSSKAFELAKVKSLLPSNSKLAIFWSSDVGASAKVPLSVARSFASSADSSEGGVTPRLLETFDNLAGGKSLAGLGVKSSDLLLSPSNSTESADVSLSAISLSAEPGLIFISAPQFILPSYNAIERAGKDTQIVFSSAWAPEEYAEKLPRHEKNKLIGMTGLYTINSDTVAKDAGVPGEEGVSTVEQIAFWLRYLPENDSSHIKSLLSTAVPAEIIDQVVSATKAGLLRIDLTNSEMDVDEEDAARPDHQLAPGEADSSIISHPTFIPVAKAGFGPNGFKSIADPAAVSASSNIVAKQLLYPEAYDSHVDAEESMRPDLPEKNYIITVTENRRLTPLDYDRNVFHMEFSTAGTGLKYAVGEALGIHGLNDEQEVHDFINWYGLNPDDVVSYPSLANPNQYENRTIFQLCQQNLDLFGKPPKSFFEALIKYATTREEKRHLRFLSSAEGASSFKKWSELDTVTYVDVLKAFPSAKANFKIGDIVREVAPIKPRHYSIASSQNAVGDSVHLLIVTVDWETPSGIKRYGQCTRYLVGLPVGAKVMVSVKPSVMKLPPRDSQPVIMAGLGTGAAPFRAFMQERAWQKSQGIDVGPLLYYFGARYRHAEYLYGEEIEAYVRDSVITQTGLAFSRDTKHKVYIQSKIAADSKLIADSLDEGVFYLCGPTWPVGDIYKALTDALVEHRGKTIQEAEAHIEELKEEERYVLEVY